MANWAKKDPEKRTLNRHVHLRHGQRQLSGDLFTRRVEHELMHAEPCDHTHKDIKDLTSYDEYEGDE